MVVKIVVRIFDNSSLLTCRFVSGSGSLFRIPRAPHLFIRGEGIENLCNWFLHLFISIYFTVISITVMLRKTRFVS